MAADFSDHLGRYVEHLRARRYSVAFVEKTLFELPRLFRHLEEQGVSDIRAIDEEHLTVYARQLELKKTTKGQPLSQWTRASALNAIRRFFAFLESHGVILRDPALSIPLPKIRRLPRGILTMDQACQLVTAPRPNSTIGKRDRAILELLYGTGLRLGEAVRMDATDLDLRERVLLVRNGKGRKDRFVPVPGRAASALDHYLTESRPALAKRFDPALFLSRHGSRLKAGSMRIMIKQHGRAIGAAITPHTLRRTCATHLLQGGASVRHVQELLGHRSITTTAIYTRVTVDDLRAVLLRAHPRERSHPERPER